MSYLEEGLQGDRLAQGLLDGPSPATGPHAQEVLNGLLDLLCLRVDLFLGGIGHLLDLPERGGLVRELGDVALVHLLELVIVPGIDTPDVRPVPILESLYLPVLDTEEHDLVLIAVDGRCVLAGSRLLGLGGALERVDLDLHLIGLFLQEVRPVGHDTRENGGDGEKDGYDLGEMLVDEPILPLVLLGRRRGHLGWMRRDRRDILSLGLRVSSLVHRGQSYRETLKGKRLGLHGPTRRGPAWPAASPRYSRR